MSPRAGQPTLSAELHQKAYHYTECGLDNVYLLGGYEVRDTPYGEGVAIRNADALHRAIGHWLVREQRRLGGSEIRFLRKELDLTQDELAQRLGTTSQTLARWEKAQVQIAGPADILLRMIYLEETRQESDPRMGLRLRELPEGTRSVNFTTHSGTWQATSVRIRGRAQRGFSPP